MGHKRVSDRMIYRRWKIWSRPQNETTLCIQAALYYLRDNMRERHETGRKSWLQGRRGTEHWLWSCTQPASERLRAPVGFRDIQASQALLPQLRGRRWTREKQKQMRWVHVPARVTKQRKGRGRHGGLGASAGSGGIGQRWRLAGSDIQAEKFTAGCDQAWKDLGRSSPGWGKSKAKGPREEGDQHTEELKDDEVIFMILWQKEKVRFGENNTKGLWNIAVEERMGEGRWWIFLSWSCLGKIPRQCVQNKSALSITEYSTQ